ncbi:MAG: EAL domain-containing protein [Gammaproteobacteria bacterium]|nr:EAL domain-containing protein [Gammaproteobacteria bacterium]
MSSHNLSGILTSGVGRRIFGFFLLAGIAPVLLTALLAYLEVGRGLEQEVSRQLREYSKAYGTEVVERLIRASNKAEQIIRESGRRDFTLDNNSYLTADFTAISSHSPVGGQKQLFGSERFIFDESAIDREHLSADNTQLVISTEFGVTSYFLLRGVALASPNEAIYAFQLNPKLLWGLKENSPYLTDFCSYTTSGVMLYCTGQSENTVVSGLIADKKLNSNFLTEWEGADGTGFVSSGWQLFTDGMFAYPAVDIIAAQPEEYALRSGADFRRIFPPALALVIILVGALSLSLIGESLVPLQRLTLVARQIASGQLDSRVRVRSDDEFGSLAEAFNNMAGRLSRQIKTMKAMAQIDKMILSGADFEEISEGLVEHLVDLTGVEAVAVIARDLDTPTYAKMISWHEQEFVHERITLPQELGHEWCQPRQVEVSQVNGAFAPYKERFLSFGLRYVFILPVVLNDDLKGILLLGSDARFEMQGSKLQISVDLAGRLAVALASAEREEALYRQAHYDELTGLPNRQLLKDRLDQHLVQARREEHSGALLFIDLDRFKEINDVFGHSVGDIVLAQAAERILAEVRETDTVARLGGDEFVIMMPNLIADNTIRTTASRILERLAETFTVRGNDHFLGASIGIVVFPNDGASVETLLKNADSAMYRAKDAGRSRFEFFSEELNAESRRKIELERDLRAAFDGEALAVHYQPQFALSDGIICGAEALLRWNHSTLGDVAPEEFIQLAEDSGLIVDIGRWVIEQTCLDLRKILDKGLHPGSMSINVSARQLRDSSFTSDVLDSLRRNDIHPGYLQLEITETTVAQNRDTAISILNSLREAGVQIAIDDFGTGYSSLSYLQELPFDRIKIDKSFVDLIGAGGNSEKICRTIIKMAHELGKESIAEGVETREQADFLADNKCDSVQGFFYSKPLVQEEFQEFVEKQDFHTQRRKALEIVS